MATATAANLSELDSILTSWATGGGSTVTEESVVTLADGNYNSTLNIAGLSFPYRVWIQGRAPASDGTSPVTMTGLEDGGAPHWIINNTTNLGIRLIEFTGMNVISIPSGTTTNLWIDRCILQGYYTAAYATQPWPSQYVFQPQGTMNGYKLTNCFIRRADSALTFFMDGANQTISGCVLLDTTNDLLKMQGVTSGTCYLTNNWGGKQSNQGPGVHADFIQAYPGTAEFHGNMTGNVIWRGTMQNAQNIALEGIFFADGARLWGNVKQNILISDSPEGLTFYSGAAVSIESNTVITCKPNTSALGQPGITLGPVSGVVNETYGNLDYNFYASNTVWNKTAFADTNTLLNMGGNGGENFDLLLPYYDQAPEQVGNIGQLTPVVSAVTHWDAATPHGASSRLYDIIVGGDHPGNVGWPVAKPWTDFWNNPAQNGDLIASTYTGSYNADGTNAGGAAPPSISGLTINVVAA